MKYKSCLEYLRFIDCAHMIYTEDEARDVILDSHNRLRTDNIKRMDRWREMNWIQRKILQWLDY